ncbi:putative soluble guanylate cyclase 89Db-like, partial [Penaeus vannamei]
LDFRNDGFMQDMLQRRAGFNRTSLPSFTLGKLFRLFPFGIVLGPELKIRLAGERILQMLGKEMLESDFLDHFTIQRPHVKLTWESMIMFQSVTWEVESKKLPKINTTNVMMPDGSYKSNTLSCVNDICQEGASDYNQAPWTGERSSLESSRGLLLKGQMYILKESNVALFLCIPLLNNLVEMRETGLFLNDLSMHDLSREMVLSGWHHCSRFQHHVQICGKLTSFSLIPHFPSLSLFSLTSLLYHSFLSLPFFITLFSHFPSSSLSFFCSLPFTHVLTIVAFSLHFSSSFSSSLTSLLYHTHFSFPPSSLSLPPHSFLYQSPPFYLSPSFITLLSTSTSFIILFFPTSLLYHSPSLPNPLPSFINLPPSFLFPSLSFSPHSPSSPLPPSPTPLLHHSPSSPHDPLPSSLPSSPTPPSPSPRHPLLHHSPPSPTTLLLIFLFSPTPFFIHSPPHPSFPTAPSPLSLPSLPIPLSLSLPPTPPSLSHFPSHALPPNSLPSPSLPLLLHHSPSSPTPLSTTLPPHFSLFITLPPTTPSSHHSPSFTHSPPPHSPPSTLPLPLSPPSLSSPHPSFYLLLSPTSSFTTALSPTPPYHPPSLPPSFSLPLLTLLPSHPSSTAHPPSSSARLQIMYNPRREDSNKLEDAYMKVEEAKTRADDLLYSMLPPGG